MNDTPSNVERILTVVKGLDSLDDARRSSFTYFFLGTLTALVRQYPGQIADDLVNDLEWCSAMFGIRPVSVLNSSKLKDWMNTLQGISSAPAEVSNPTTPGAGASGMKQAERSQP